MTEESTTHDAESAPGAPPPADPDPVRGSVILIAGPLSGPGRDPLPALALALAGRGHSLILWSGAPDREDAANTLLDLQLAIERAGGISLEVAGPELALAAEAFGRIDAAVALGPIEAARVAAAAARLERDRRPRRLVVLVAAGQEGPPPGATLCAASENFPPGMKVTRLPVPVQATGEAGLDRIAREISGQE